MAPGGRRPLVSFEDVLPPALIAAQNQATYAIEVVNQRGRSAGLSNQVRMPLLPAAPPPADFRATLDAQGPLLEWDVRSIPRLLPASPTVCASIGEPAARPISRWPASSLTGLGKTRLATRNFEWEQEYDYKITAVTVLATAGAARGGSGRR